MWIAQIDASSKVKAVVEMREPIAAAPAGVTFVQIEAPSVASPGQVYQDGAFVDPPEAP